jgi:hypothetical protein
MPWSLKNSIKCVQSINNTFRFIRRGKNDSGLTHEKGKIFIGYYKTKKLKKRVQSEC